MEVIQLFSAHVLNRCQRAKYKGPQNLNNLKTLDFNHTESLGAAGLSYLPKGFLN